MSSSERELDPFEAEEQRLLSEAAAADEAAPVLSLTLEDFRYDQDQDAYRDLATGKIRAANAVDAAIFRENWPTRLNNKGEPEPYKPSIAIREASRGLVVDGATTWPGRPQIIANMISGTEGMVPAPGRSTLNLYRPPERPDVPEGVTADRWIEHVKRLYPEPKEHEHLFDYLAHALQDPGTKVNHGVLLAGTQGIGKDTLLYPATIGVGAANVASIDPEAITADFSTHAGAVLVIINEFLPIDLDKKASHMYNSLKSLLAAPPIALPVNRKYANTVYVQNVAHVFLTTNEPLGIFIPDEDRRICVLTSPLKPGELGEAYFSELWGYLLNGGGAAAVIEWLYERDLSRFKPTAPPPMTHGKEQIIASGTEGRRSPGDDLVADFIASVYDGEPPEIIFMPDIAGWAAELRSFDSSADVNKVLAARGFHHRIINAGYNLVRRPGGAEFKRAGFRTRIAFVRDDVPRGEQLDAALAELERRPLTFRERENNGKAIERF